MKISPSQFEKIRVKNDSNFVIAMSTYLIDRFSLHSRPGFSADELVQETENITNQGMELGPLRYDGYALHVIAAFVLGVDYHLTPTVKPILHSDLISSELKTLWLERWLDSVEQRSSNSRNK